MKFQHTYFFYFSTLLHKIQHQKEMEGKFVLYRASPGSLSHSTRQIKIHNAFIHITQQQQQQN